PLASLFNVDIVSPVSWANAAEWNLRQHASCQQALRRNRHDLPGPGTRADDLCHEACRGDGNGHRSDRSHPLRPAQSVPHTLTVFCMSLSSLICHVSAVAPAVISAPPSAVETNELVVAVGTE